MATMSLSKILMHGLMQSAMLENMMTSAERVLEYGQLEKEGPLKSAALMPEKKWPIQGSVNFTNVNLRYDSNPDSVNVLRDINLNMPGGKKV